MKKINVLQKNSFEISTSKTMNQDLEAMIFFAKDFPPALGR